MKLPHLILLVFGFVYNLNLKAQQLVELDLMSSESVVNQFPISQGEWIRFRIKNINRKIYSVQFNSETRSFYQGTPAIFDLPTKIDISKLQGFTPQDKGHSQCQRLNDLSEKVSDKERAVIDAYSRAFCRLTPDGSIKTFYRAHGEIRKINDYKKALDLLGNSACLTFDTLSAIKKRMGQELVDDTVNEYKSEFELFHLIEERFRNEFEKIQLGYTEANADFEIVKRTFPQVTAIKDAFVNGKTSGIRNPIEQEFSNEISRYGNLVEVISAMKASYLEIQNLKDQRFIESLREEYNYISDLNFFYASPIVKAEKDQIKIMLNITTKTPTDCGALVDKFNGTYEYDVYGFKVDYSVGVFLNMGANIFDQTYRLDSIPGDQLHNQIKRNENKNVMAPTLGALMHFYWTSKSKSGKLTNGKGFNFGLSLSTQSKLNYHFGLSYLFLGTNRIVLNAGAVLTQVQLISDQYKEDGVVDKSLTSIPMQNFYRIGGYFGLSWNIGRN